MPSTRTEPTPERLRLARREAGLTQEKVGERAGLARNSIARYESGSGFPSQLALNMLATIYGKPVEWFYGDEPDVGVQQPPAPVTVMEPPLTQSDDDREFAEGILTEIQAYVRQRVEARAAAPVREADDELPDRDPVDVKEIAAAAGGGADVYDETVTGRLWFRRDWLQRNAIDPQQCNIIRVRGESMEPALPDGCSILVDRSQGRRRRRAGRIFVLRTGDGLIVKRVGRDDQGNWQIESEHPSWPPVPWDAANVIIGEVRWCAVTF